MIIAESIVFSAPGSVCKYRLVNPDQYRSYDLSLPVPVQALLCLCIYLIVVVVLFSSGIKFPEVIKPVTAVVTGNNVTAVVNGKG